MLPLTLSPSPPHPSRNEMDHMHPVACYLGPDGLETYLTHPYASPLFGSFDRLPPLLIQSGDAEVLRDEIMLLAHKARCARVEVRHEMYEDAVCVFSKKFRILLILSRFMFFRCFLFWSVLGEHFPHFDILFTPFYRSTVLPNPSI